MQIIHRYSSKVLHDDASATVMESVVAAVASGADLGGAYLRGADLSGAYLRGADLGAADLSGAYLRGADLRGAYLRWADLSRADLSRADLRWADLSRADLSGAKVEWSSHDLIAQILRRSAKGDVDKLSFAGLVLIQRAWCWGDHLALKGSQLEWALRELAKWIQPDDCHPRCLDAFRAEPSAAADGPVEQQAVS